MAMTWNEALALYSDTEKFQIFTRDVLQHRSLGSLLYGLHTPAPTVHLLQNLSQSHLSVWDAFVLSMRQVDTQIKIFPPLAYFLQHAVNVAVIYGEFYEWNSPDEWRYLFQISNPLDENKRLYVVAYPPATQEHIRQAEAVLGMRLPPSYASFLRCTNGLGLGAEPDEFYFIYGAGDARALWNEVVGFQQHPSAIHDYHEISSNWLQWQDLLAYERERDRETGISSFMSDERVCVPFAYKGDNWCFDRSHPDKRGEYPVLFWDHEIRESTWAYSDFSPWFTDIVSGLSDDD